MKKIRFVFSSGLGNQLFMYALYLYLQKNWPQARVTPSLFPYEYLNPHNGFELHRLFCDPQLEVAFARLPKCRKREDGREPALHMYARLLRDKLLRYRNVTDAMFSDEASLRKWIDSFDRIQMVGFFQLPDFARSVLPEMKKRLRPIVWRSRNARLLADMAGRTTCSIHVRRGDYVGNPYFDIMDYGRYYSQAIRTVEEKHGQVHFILFSDDTAWASEMLALPASKLTVCDWNNGTDSYLDMFMMARCDHNILANSSFSYWGGYSITTNIKPLLPRACGQRA